MDSILETLYVAINLFNGFSDITVFGIPLRSFYLAILTVELIGLFFGMTVKASGKSAHLPYHPPAHAKSEYGRYQAWLYAHRK